MAVLVMKFWNPQRSPLEKATPASSVGVSDSSIFSSDRSILWGRKFQRPVSFLCHMVCSTSSRDQICCTIVNMLASRGGGLVFSHMARGIRSVSISNEPCFFPGTSKIRPFSFLVSFRAQNCRIHGQNCRIHGQEMKCNQRVIFVLYESIRP